jgi:hypothetical protein
MRREFGAGPLFAFDPDPGAGGDLNALQTISVPDPHVYNPDLQLNRGNEPEGDLVSGTFDAMQPPVENDDYTRLDFIPGIAMSVSDCPDSEPGSPPIADDAFLVRLRRTNDFDGLDELAGVSSRGPALPLLFGRGAAIGSDPDAEYSPRIHGLTVRATAIAQAYPALTVGPQVAVPGFAGLGLAPFDIHLELANMLGEPQLATIEPLDGTIRWVGSVPCDSVEADNCGRFIGVPPSPVSAGDLRLLAGTVGSCDPLAAPEANTVVGYAPVYDTIGASATPRIIGFVHLAMAWPDCPGAPESIVLTMVGRVAPANATAMLPNGWPIDLPLEDRPEILFENRRLNDPSAGVQVALLAPVLVR